MKERPILFSGPMVRAILDGRKTMTRRVVKPQPNMSEYRDAKPSAITSHGYKFPVVEWYSPSLAGHGSGVAPFQTRCPYGTIGDRLWVRETWCEYGSSRAIYRADYGHHTPISDGIGGPWKPSIHMPRWASRLTLEITDVRVERLQDITEDDAKSEGVEPYRCPQADVLMNAVGGGMKPIPYTSGFANLWNEINGKTCPWSSNPWVWVVSFKRIEVC